VLSILSELNSVGIVALNGFLRNICCCTNLFICVWNRLVSEGGDRETSAFLFAFVAWCYVQLASSESAPSAATRAIHKITRHRSTCAHHCHYHPTERLITKMAGLARDIYYEQFHQCAALYDEKKRQECVKACLAQHGRLHNATLLANQDPPFAGWRRVNQLVQGRGKSINTVIRKET